MEAKQPREKLGALEAIVDGFILSALLSFFLFLFIRDWVTYEIQTSVRKDSVLANADKK